MPLAVHVPRAGHQTTPISPAQSILSTLVLIPCRSDPRFQRYKPRSGPVFVTFHIFAVIRLTKSPCCSNGEMTAFHHVPRAHYSPHRSHILTRIVVHPCSIRCANFSLLTQAVWAAPRDNRPHHTQKANTQTDRQTDSHYSNSIVDKRFPLASLRYIDLYLYVFSCVYRM